MEEIRQNASHTLTIKGRKNGSITGVHDVSSFDEKEILLLTDAGKLMIRGEGLHVRQLDLKNGEVELDGRVDSLTYLSKNAEKKEEPFLKRMFR